MISLAYRWRSPVLLFHSVFHKVPKDLEGHVHNVTPDEFRRIVSELSRSFEFVFVDEFISKSGTKPRCAITFDDAYDCIFDDALQILRDLNIPSTVFVNCSSLGGTVFWRDRVRWLIRNNLVDEFLRFAGYDFHLKSKEALDFYAFTKSSNIDGSLIFQKIESFFAYKSISLPNFCVSSTERLFNDDLITYGNHSFRHLVLSSLEKSQQRAEITKNKMFLETLNVQLSKVFSIPFGGASDFNQTTIEEIKRAGYIGALLSRNRLTPNQKCQNFGSGDKLLPVIERFMVKTNVAQHRTHMKKLMIKEALFGVLPKALY